MKPASFEYIRPTSLDEALQALAEHGPDAKIIAGGQSLVPMLNFRLARPEVLIDINGLKDLNFHVREGNLVRIGALARHATLLESDLIRDACPLMSEAYRFVAHSTIRNRGTLCGNLSHADPASEMPAVMLALGATMEIRSVNETREVSASDFFQGLYATAVEPHEMLVEVHVPVRSEHQGFGFKEVSIRQGDFALTAVASLLDIDDGHIQAASIAYAGVSDRAIRLVELEEHLVGQAPSSELFAQAGEMASDLLELTEDMHADRDYRKDLVRTLTPRALSEAAERAAVGV